ncbi:MAG TPA: DUF4383 domain-containing protein [Chthoniobacterales bacterium]|nr:DUF4383 domain-containing protein [Chthoniobacterales bacterium]
MLKTAATIFGIFFIIAGIGGFVPALAPSHGDGNMLFGIFMVGPVHNIVHLASGAAALFCAFSGAGAARKYFQIFGSVYLLVALIGFIYGNSPIMGVMEHNTADIGLHILIAAVALYFGFAGGRDTADARA